MISQSISLPVVYRRQREWYAANERAQQAMISWKQQELAKEIKIVYWNLADLLARRKLLLRLDSVYSRFLAAANLRLRAGEGNLLEKTTAEAHTQQLKIQLQQLASDALIFQERLQWLLNTEEKLLPELSDTQPVLSMIPDTSVVGNHPLVRYREQQVNMAAALTSVERNKLVPDITAGYNNMSIVGYQSTDGVTQHYYGAGRRFSSVSLGLAIPLFGKSIRNKVRAGQINEEAARINQDATHQQLKSQLLQWMEERNKQQRQVSYYQDQGLSQSELIIRQAALSFEKGQLSYLEWTMLMNNAIHMQLAGLDALRQLHLINTEIEYLTGN